MSITRSATMHSRPIDTCWKTLHTHSWPTTVFAPIRSSPSWTRIFEPCPIHDQRPSTTFASGPISNVTPGPDEAQPVGLQPPAERTFSHAQRAMSRA